MRGSIRLFRVFGIAINIHMTFFLLLLFALTGGVRWLVLVIAVFFFVTLHELCHSLVAKRFGIKTAEITLFPIGGLASMAKMPERPLQELAISIAGPSLNLAIIAIFFFPLRMLLGPEVFFNPSTLTWPSTLAYVYWLNLMLAGFNLLPAFPMDGGRVFRALLAIKIGYQKATKIAVNFGHLFSLIFAYFGIVRFNLILIIIAVFIYTAASSEELQLDIKENLKKFIVRDILPRDFMTLAKETTLSKVLELMFHSHQEDFPVVEDGKIAGFAARQDIMAGIHSFGMDRPVSDVMRRNFPKVRLTDTLLKAQAVMSEKGVRALPVMRDDEVVGVITLEDISRVYSMMSQR